MKKSVLCSLVVASLSVVPVGSAYAASTMTTTTTGLSTSTMMPGGVESVCNFKSSGGLKSADLKIPDSVISGAMGQVNSLIGASVAMKEVKKRLQKIINKKAGEFCTRVARLNKNEGGEASVAEAENVDIYTDYSAYTDQIKLIDTQIETLAATITPANAGTVLGQINTLTEQQITVMETMESDMDKDATQFTEDRRNVAGKDPAVDDSGADVVADDETAMCDKIYSPPASLPPEPDPLTATPEEIAEYEADKIEYDILMTEFLDNVNAERKAASTGKFDEDGNPVDSLGGCFLLSGGSVCCSDN